MDLLVFYLAQARERGMNPSVFFPAKGRMVFKDFLQQRVLKKENVAFKAVVLHL